MDLSWALMEGITQECNASNSSNVKFVKFLNNVNVGHKLLKTSQTPMNKLPLSSIFCEVNKSLELKVTITIIWKLIRYYYKKHGFSSNNIVIKIIIKSNVFVSNDWQCLILLKSKLICFLNLKTNYSIKMNNVLDMCDMWHLHGLIWLMWPMWLRWLKLIV